MATAFWEAHQNTGKMYNACAAAIAYADAHPEILVPLGSGYHGWPSHKYTPADICPFRQIFMEKKCAASFGFCPSFFS